MKSSCQKRLRITGIAAAVSAMLLAGTALSGCRDSKNQSNDDGVKLTVAEEGDLTTGKPYRIRADRRLQELRADHGDLIAVNPVTGENAGENEWFYILPEEYFTSYELNYGSDDDDGNNGESNSLKAFTETFRATLPDGETLEVKQTFAVTDMFLNGGYLYIVGTTSYDDTYPFLMTSESDAVDLAYNPASHDVIRAALSSG
ncbi:hypothetical protein [Succinimonas sp.]|uniref:hypothetical protein n=1 Tax=Succinimonas sp. TaxID=1936151 RepID=UPI00386383FE